MNTPWKQLIFRKTTDLKPTIAYIHHAAQLAAAVGNSLLPKADDDSQSNLEWISGINSLAGPIINGQFRAALRYLPFELLVLDDANRIREGGYIPGQTEKELFNWLKKAITRMGANGNNLHPIDHYKIPPHEVDKGKPYPEIDSSIHLELANYRSNADWVINEVTGLYRDVSTVRTWPHHFDTGAIINLARNEEGGVSKTIGLGWAIPDEQFDEPYFYVNHWSSDKKPNYDTLPELEGNGIWYLDTWKGAILKSSHIVKHKQAEDQQQEVLQFFRSAIRASKSLLE